MNVTIEPSWRRVLSGEFEKPYFVTLAAFIKKEYQNGTIYPSPKNIFRAFEECPFEKVKVVLLGQDPYHGVRQANGLAFAVQEQEAIPPSLQNIFKEIESDLGTSLIHRSGDLTRFAKQGVLLLNATLTVRAHLPGSHQGQGWELLTDAAIRALSEEREHLVFILWGTYAKRKGAHIDRSKHLVLEAPHPSPFSAHNGFFGSRPFSRANEYLKSHQQTPIDWL
ncbi:MAG TPA: uracil-DNA glycosylase [Candidatus Paceibacterota bacterium]|nr:uracil-DNA glycosylase [Candidatus Paceibacterota bacterium]